MPAMQTSPPAPLRAYAAMLGGLFIIGFSAILVRTANAPGAVIAFYRVGIGALALTIPFLAQLRRGARLPRPALAFSVLAGLFFGADLAAWSTGIVLSGATIPTLLANTAPLWVGLGAWMLFKEQLSGQFWLGLALALLGAALVLGLNLSGELDLDRGALLGAVAGFFYGGFFLAAQRGRGGLGVFIFFWVAAVSSAVLILLAILVLGLPLGGYSTATWWNLVAQGVIVQAGGWLLVSYAQGYLPASLVSPTLLGQPVSTAILAGPMLGEILRPVDLLGGAAVLAGIFLVHRSRRARKREREAIL